MRISFVLPVVNMAGGIKVAAIYAKFLADKGHEVLLVSPPHRKLSFRQKLKSFLMGKGWPRIKPHDEHLQCLGLNHRKLEKYRPVSDKDLPDADVVIATWWETAEWVNALSPSKGAKIYFIQGYEMFDFVPQERCEATYKFPFHKIVIAGWLLDLMRTKYGDNNVDLVLNSVDKMQFYANERDKQQLPTIGFLYGFSHIKGVDITLQVIKRLKEFIPNLRIISFGSFMPNNFPMWDDAIEFYYLPAQDRIRDLYAQCDVWITTSRTEGFNLTVMEAMACHTPVVSTKTGWPAEGIINGYNGFLTEVDDVDALVDAAKTLLLESNEVWKKYSQNAYNTLENSSWQASSEMFEEALIRGFQRAKNDDQGKNWKVKELEIE
ncbi:MAG: glycosyltransferase family 4 protein [Methylotenera sp.]